jgi:lipopolysaccharide export system permease protein
MGQRVFTGVMVGVIFQTLQNMFSTSSLVFGFSPFVAVMLPIAVCASLGFVMILRAR